MPGPAGQCRYVIISPLVLAQVDHLAKVRFGARARDAILGNIITQALLMRFHVPEVSPDALKLARDVQRKYADLDLDLADAVNITLAADYRTDAILTLDRRDFRAIRPLTPHKAFRVLPDDL